MVRGEQPERDQGQRIQRCADRQPAQVQSGIHQQHRQLVRAACPGLCRHGSPCAARPYSQQLASMTPYKGEFGCFAAYVRTQQSAFSVRTYAAIDQKRTI